MPNVLSYSSALGTDNAPLYSVQWKSSCNIRLQ